MNKNEYTHFMSKVKAPSGAVEKAVEGIYEEKKSATITEFKPRGKRGFGLALAAAVLCLVLLSGVVFFPFGGGTENNFVITAGAKEINNYELTKLGELKCELDSYGIIFNEKNRAICITMCQWLDFPISCTGENVESVTYKMQGKGCFAIPKTATNITEKVSFMDSKEIAPQDKVHLQGVNDAHSYGENLSSFTTDYLYQNQAFVLCLYTSDNNGPYCEKYNLTAQKTEDGISHGKDFDYQQMYYDLFSADDYSVEITANFKDGTSQTKVVDLVIEKTDRQSEYEFTPSLTISAKLAE